MSILKKVLILWKDQVWSTFLVLFFCVFLVSFDQFIHISQRSEIDKLNHIIYNKCMTDMDNEINKNQLKSAFVQGENTQIKLYNITIFDKQYRKYMISTDYTLLFIYDINDCKSNLTKDLLIHSPVISNMTNTQSNHSLQLFVVCECNDVKNDHNDIEYPDSWIITHSLEITDKLQNGETCNNIWLLDKYKRVVLKNTSFKIAEQWLLAL